jgi:Holliday junction resolvase
MRESKIQKSLIDDLEKQGFYVIKLSVTNKNGIPDIVAFPKGCGAVFYEVKQKGKEPSQLQNYRIKELNNHGIKVYVYDGNIIETNV